MRCIHRRALRRRYFRNGRVLFRHALAGFREIASGNAETIFNIGHTSDDHVAGFNQGGHDVARGFTVLPQVPAVVDITGDFDAFLAKADAAQREFQQGNPALYKAMWSHQPDVTLAGGFGGSFEQGWDRGSARLDWASAQFRNGRNEIQRLTSGTGGDIGYLVQTEHLTFNTPGQTDVVERRYRVTMLFRRETDGWRIIHRHADSQNTQAAPK